MGLPEPVPVNMVKLIQLFVLELDGDRIELGQFEDTLPQPTMPAVEFVEQMRNHFMAAAEFRESPQLAQAIKTTIKERCTPQTSQAGCRRCRVCRWE